MAWKGVHLTKPSRLSLSDGQLVVEQDAIVRIALEDIGWIIVDDPRVTLTSTLLSACMAAGIALLISDARHTPSGVVLPFHTHHRQAAVAAAQLALSEPRKKRLWQAIVKAKVENQAGCLEALKRPGAEGLYAMATRIGSGDPDNVEARAARAYWQSLFDDFVRSDDEDRRNKLLNYGYAVVRAGVARALVACGLLPSIGLHHASETNAFNLADDLVEPFRPIVDAAVYGITGPAKPKTSDLTLEDRRLLAGLLLRDVQIGPDITSLLVATEQAAESLTRAFADPQLLKLPRVSAAGPSS